MLKRQEDTDHDDAVAELAKTMLLSTNKIASSPSNKSSEYLIQVTYQIGY